MPAGKPKKAKYVPQPYEQMSYPGQRIQVDVKHVPRICQVASGDRKYYQYMSCIGLVREGSKSNAFKRIMGLSSLKDWGGRRARKTSPCLSSS